VKRGGEVRAMVVRRQGKFKRRPFCISCGRQMPAAS
jgi:hypothetical protein